MKNLTSVEQITDFIKQKFASRADFNDFRLLLLSSGVKEDDLESFFVYVEGGEGIEVGISAYGLKKRMLKNEEFLIKLATGLYQIISNGEKQILEYSLSFDGYFLSKEMDFYKDKILFKVSYNPIDRTIRVNDLVISKTHSFSENDDVIDYLIKHPNRKIKLEVRNKKERILKCKGGGKIILKKRPADIVRNLGFEKLAAKLFFPGTGVDTLHFRNPITPLELKKRGFKEDITLEDLFPKSKSDKN